MLAAKAAKIQACISEDGGPRGHKNMLMTEIRLTSLVAWVHCFLSYFKEEAEVVTTQEQITRGAGGRDME